MTSFSKLKLYFSLEVIIPTIYICSAVVISFLNLFFPQSLLREIILFLILYIPIFIYLIKKNNFLLFRIFFPFLFFSIIFTFFYFIYPSYNQTYNTEILRRIFYTNSGIIAFSFGAFYIKRKNIIYSFKVLSILLFFYYFWRPIIGDSSNHWFIDGYSMDYGYQMLTPTILSFIIFVIDKNKFYFIIFLIGSILILLYGSRGTLVSIFFMLLMYFIFLSNYKFRRSKFSILFISILLLVLFYIFSPFLLEILLSIVDKIGVDSRTLYLIINNTFTTDVHRMRIINEAISLILKNPFFGHGPLADQHYLNIYVHNIFLELLINFGFFGLLFFVILIGLTIKTLISKKIDFSLKFIMIGFISLSLVKLMVSSSFWYENMFWIYLAFLFNLNLKKKLIL